LIVFILPNFSGGGAERVVVNFIIGLHQKKVDVEIIVFNSNGPLVSEIPKGVTVHNLQTENLRQSIFPLIAKLKSLNPRVIFSTFGYINIAVLSFRLFLPKNIVIWIREANLPSISLPNNSFSLLMSMGYRWVYRTADKILCTSQRMTDEFIRDFNLPVSKLQFLPNPVNEKRIQSAIVNIVIGHQNDNVNFVAMGRLTHQKGFDRLLQWFAKIKNKDSVLRILGSGPLEASLKDLSQKLHLSERVIFEGYCDNPWGKIAASDVFLLSSRWEGMSNAALEALTCGTPVIATSNSGGIAELGGHVKEGTVIVTSTADEFIQEMDKVKPKNTQYPKGSLLPPIYSMDHAVLILQSWLNLYK